MVNVTFAPKLGVLLLAVCVTDRSAPVSGASIVAVARSSPVLSFGVESGSLAPYAVTCVV
jgi:hypothetical protein